MTKPAALAALRLPALFAAFAIVCLGADTYAFRIAERVNVHGDEFMAVARTGDGKRLVIGTETGEILIWGIVERKVLKRLNQGSPVHCVVALGEPQFIIAAGGAHAGQKRYASIRKWDIVAGTFEELPQTSQSAFMALAVDSASGTVVAATMGGQIMAWNAEGILAGSRNLNLGVSAMTLLGRMVAVTTGDREAAQRTVAAGELPLNSIVQFPIDRLDETPRVLAREQPGRYWIRVDQSPDEKYLAFSFTEKAGPFVAVVARADGREIARFPRRSSASWCKDGSLLLFDQEVPAELMKIDANGQPTRTDLVAGSPWQRTGSPADLTGRVISDDHSLVWETFRLGNMLSLCSLGTKSCDSLYRVSPMVLAMDLRDRPDGVVATGGDDGFVRVWKQPDFSLVREFQVASGAPQGVATMDDGQTVIFSYSGSEGPSSIMAGDLDSGTAKALLTVPQPYVRVLRASGGFLYASGQKAVLADPRSGQSIREFPADSRIVLTATSPNGDWFAATDDKGTLYCFEVKTGRRLAQSKDKIPSVQSIAVGNDGQAVFTTELAGAVKRWQPGSSIKLLATVRSQVRALFVSSDGTRLALGGDHRDTTVYDAKSGQLVFTGQSPDSDTFVTNVWTSGDRLMFTTDAGALLTGTLKR